MFDHTGIPFLNGHISYIGSAEFTGQHPDLDPSATTGEARLAGNTIQIDVDGDGFTDMAFHVQNLAGTLSNGNFVVV